MIIHTTILWIKLLPHGLLLLIKKLHRLILFFVLKDDKSNLVLIETFPASFDQILLREALFKQLVRFFIVIFEIAAILPVDDCYQDK